MQTNIENYPFVIRTTHNGRRRPMNDDDREISLYTIFERPLDFPNSFVVRRFKTLGGTVKTCELVAVAPTLEAARAALPPGLFNLRRKDQDEPHIVETWI